MRSSLDGVETLFLEDGFQSNVRFTLGSNVSGDHNSGGVTSFLTSFTNLAKNIKEIRIKKMI